MAKLDELAKEVEELAEEYRAKVEAGELDDIPLHNIEKEVSGDW